MTVFSYDSPMIVHPNDNFCANGAAKSPILCVNTWWTSGWFLPISSKISASSSNPVIGKPSLLGEVSTCYIWSKNFVTTVWDVITLNHGMYLNWFSLHHCFFGEVRSTSPRKFYRSSIRRQSLCQNQTEYVHVYQTSDTLVFYHTFLFVCLDSSSHSRIFHSSWRRHHCQWRTANLTYVRHSWPLSSEGSLMCYIHCDTGLLFIMVISEDPWHSQLLPSVWQWSYHYLFLRLRSVATGDRTPISRMRGERSTSTPRRRFRCIRKAVRAVAVTTTQAHHSQTWVMCSRVLSTELAAFCVETNWCFHLRSELLNWESKTPWIHV